MRRFLVCAVMILFAALTLSFALLWSASYRWTIDAAGTEGTSLNHFIARRGTLYWWGISPWWRHEEWQVDTDPKFYGDPIDEWPGMFIEHHRRGLGFEKVSGRWKSPSAKVTRADRPLDKRMPLQVGSIHSVMVPFQILGIPLWAALLLSFGATFVLFRLWKKTRGTTKLK